MKLSEIVALDKVKYTHIYNQTLCSHESADHIIDCPKVLKTLADKYDAEIERYGAGQLVIKIDGKPVYSNDAGTRDYLRLKDLNFKKWNENPWLFIESSGFLGY